MAEAPIVIVGASLAGLRTAESLRQHGYDGPLTLVGAEPHMPYDRPPLSKQVLAGKAGADDTALVVPEDLGARFLLGRAATGLDPAGRRLILDDGDELQWSGLVVATGARPRLLPGAPPGPGLHYLRTLDDAVALRRDLESGGPLVIVGAGFIGLEVASSATALGVPVTVIEALPVPLERALGPDTGAAVLAWHRSKGLDIRTGTGFDRVVVGGDGRPRAVRLSGGSQLEAATVVIGIGVIPETGWLDGSGLDLADGLICDERLRALAGGRPAAGVVAAGDVARWLHPGYGETVRVEHWTHATESAEAAALALLRGDDAPPYAPVPYFWSDQQGMKLQFVGRTAAGDESQILEGGFDEDRVLIAYGREGRLVGALGIRRPARVMALQRMIAEGAPFPPPI